MAYGFYIKKQDFAFFKEAKIDTMSKGFGASGVGGWWIHCIIPSAMTEA
jgi:hypothetical protein